jgi:peptidoglycan/LPS O-acetylase OafA/YrhL
VDHLKSTRFTHPQFLLLYGHFWSLCVEEQFYLIWPPIVFAVRRRETLMKICLAVVLLSPVIRLICSLTLSPVLLNAGFEERFTLLQCDGLLLGGFFALWLRGPTPDLSRLARRMLAVVAGITLIAKILCPILYHRPLLPSIGDWIFASLGYSCVNVAAAAIVLLAIDPRTLLSKALQQRNLRWLGTISYGFYVLHDLPHVLYYRFAQSITHGHFVNLTAIAFGFTGTLLLASLSYYGFERPFLNLKRRFTIKPALASSSLGAPQGNGTAP